LSTAEIAGGKEVRILLIGETLDDYGNGHAKGIYEIAVGSVEKLRIEVDIWRRLRCSVR